VSAGSPPADGAEIAFVALGSNLGDREQELASGLRGLAATPGVEIVRLSRIFETEPVGPPQGAYLNAVVELRVRLAPLALLDRLLEIERASGRRRERLRNAPRTLDLDLLLYGSVCIDHARLVVPHPRLAERGFVLEPLRDLAPDRLHPRIHETIAVLAERVRDERAVRPFASTLEVPWPSSQSASPRSAQA
jgi:2-amino-4-hydroxy-6-hydroxymethyldihydropteridine diphosphokinase